MNSRAFFPLAFAILLCLQATDASRGQEGNEVDIANGDVDPTAPTYSTPVRNRWKVGVTVTGGAARCKNMIITIPVPTDWPEQTVQLDDETVPTEVRVIKYRTLDGGVKQMIALMPSVQAGEVIELSQIYEVETLQVSPPTETDSLKIPKRVDKAFRPYLGVSPQISFRNGKLRAAVKAATQDVETDWGKVEAIYDWVRDNIQQDDEVETEDTVRVFRNRVGNSEDKAALFVAMCRALKVPARMVWVEGNQYAEFYLINGDDYGHWYPCQLAGFREFGAMSEPRIILQKGDNIKVPEKESPEKFVAEFAITKGTSRPSVKFHRELLPADD
jgi:transglutaminase-like putative cysteine protease